MSRRHLLREPARPPDGIQRQLHLCERRQLQLLGSEHAGNTFRGTVTVTAAPLSLSLSAKPLLVTYGAAAVLAGTLSTQQAGENVDVLAQPCGTPSSLEVHDGADDCGRRLHGDCQAVAEHGVLDEVESRDEHRHHRSRPAEPAACESRSRSLLAPRPRRIDLRGEVRELPALQRHASSARGPVRTVLLKASSTGVAPTVVSVASFRSSIRAGLRVRATFGQAQVGSCYAAGLSNTILS